MADSSLRRFCRLSLQPPSFDFPSKLLRMLDEAEKDGTEHIFSWFPNGKVFRVHKRAEFIKIVLPKYYYRINIRSFLRQLNLYGFQRVKEKTSPEYGAYFHPFFIRNEPELLVRLKRNLQSSSSATAKKDVSRKIASPPWGKQRVAKAKAMQSETTQLASSFPFYSTKALPANADRAIQNKKSYYLGCACLPGEVNEKLRPSCLSKSIVLQQRQRLLQEEVYPTVVASIVTGSSSLDQFKLIISMLLSDTSTAKEALLKQKDPDEITETCKSSQEIKDILSQLEPTPILEE